VKAVRAVNYCGATWFKSQAMSVPGGVFWAFTIYSRPLQKGFLGKYGFFMDGYKKRLQTFVCNLLICMVARGGLEPPTPAL
jgi:hypothetical protein